MEVRRKRPETESRDYGSQATRPAMTGTRLAELRLCRLSFVLSLVSPADPFYMKGMLFTAR